MISAPTKTTFEIATIMKTIDITLIIDVALSKTLSVLMVNQKLELDIDFVQYQVHLLKHRLGDNTRGHKKIELLE